MAPSPFWLNLYKAYIFLAYFLIFLFGIVLAILKHVSDTSWLWINVVGAVSAFFGAVIYKYLCEADKCLANFNKENKTRA